MSKGRGRGKGSRRQNAVQGGNGAQGRPLASTAPVIAKSVEGEIAILGAELAKARDAGDSAAICRFAETLANIKAKATAMSCQMDATLRKILSAGGSLPMTVAPSSHGGAPLVAVSDTVGKDEDMADEGHEEDAGTPGCDDGDDVPADSEDGHTADDGDPGSDAPNSGEDTDADV